MNEIITMPEIIFKTVFISRAFVVILVVSLMISIVETLVKPNIKHFMKRDE
jgi:hypothetical protein